MTSVPLARVEPRAHDLNCSLRRFLIDEFQARIVAEWPADMTVLDLGGHKTQKRGQFDVGRFPFRTTCLNLTAEKRPDVQGDAERLPFADGTFDAVICAELLEHVFDPRQVVREIRRVLRPGGRVLITVPFLVPIHGDPGDFGRYTDAFWIRVLALLGFERVSIETQGFFWTVVLDALRSWLIEMNRRWPAQRWRWAVVARLIVWGRRRAIATEGGARPESSEALRQFTTGFGITARVPGEASRDGGQRVIIAK